MIYTWGKLYRPIAHHLKSEGLVETQPNKAYIIYRFSCVDERNDDHPLHMTIHIPDQAIADRDESKVRLALALAMYQQDIFTLGQSAKLANLSQPTFQKELGKRHIPVHYGVEEFERDVLTVHDRNCFIVSTSSIKDVSE